MASLPLTPVGEFLRTIYEPDCDYVDGIVVDRNGGEYDHSTVQALLLRYLLESPDVEQIRIKPELRMRLSARRYRVPDLLVMRRTQKPERVLTTPPMLCIEILSPEDRMSRIEEKVTDYLAFGVEYVWVIDPQRRTAWTYTKAEVQQVRDQLTTGDPDLSVSLSRLFADLVEEQS